MASWTVATAGLTGVLAVILAALVFFPFPGRRTNQALGAFLLFEGANFLADGALKFVTAANLRSGFAGILILTTLMLPAVYVWFVATAIRNRLTVPFRNAAGRTVLLLYTAGVAAFYFTSPRSGRTPPAWLILMVFVLLLTASLYGTVAAVLQFRAERRGGLGRQRALAYLIAFGSRDAGWIFLAGIGTTVVIASGPDFATDIEFWLYACFTVTETVFVLALAFGLLRLQVLDFDLKVHRTMIGGTIAAILVGAFFVASAVAQSYFDQAYGWVYGGVATGLLLFAIHPLQRLGERIARRAFGPARPTSELDLEQRREFYREQVVLAWQDRVIGKKERALLRNVRERLRLSREDAGRIELEATGG